MVQLFIFCIDMFCTDFSAISLTKGLLSSMEYVFFGVTFSDFLGSLIPWSVFSLPLFREAGLCARALPIASSSPHSEDFTYGFN